MPKMISTSAVVVDGSLKLDVGQEIDTAELPAGSVESMIRVGQLVPPEEWSEPQEVEDGDPDPPADDWLDTKVADSNLSKAIKEALATAGLDDARSIIAFAAANGGSLVAVDGIAEASEKHVQEWLLSIKAK